MLILLDNETKKLRDKIAKGFKASFFAQKDASLGVRSFCDFLTLLSEYEAFQFGNYILGKLTNWKVNLSDMGTLASQYDSHGHSKLDLSELIKNTNRKRLWRSLISFIAISV